MKSDDPTVCYAWESWVELNGGRAQSRTSRSDGRKNPSSHTAATENPNSSDSTATVPGSLQQNHHQTELKHDNQSISNRTRQKSVTENSVSVDRMYAKLRPKPDQILQPSMSINEHHGMSNKPSKILAASTSQDVAVSSDVTAQATRRSPRYQASQQGIPSISDRKSKMSTKRTARSDVESPNESLSTSADEYPGKSALAVGENCSFWPLPFFIFMNS